MTEEFKGKKITFHCPDDIAERIDRLAEKSDIARSKLILNMVETMVGFLESTQKVGIFHLALMLRDAGDRLKEVGKKWKDKKSITDLTENS